MLIRFFPSFHEVGERVQPQVVRSMGLKMSTGGGPIWRFERTGLSSIA